MTASTILEGSYPPAPTVEELIQRVEAKEPEHTTLDGLEPILKQLNIPFDKFVRAVGLVSQEQDKESVSREINLVSLESERTAEISERTWFVEGMITNGSNLIIAKKGIGKSFLVLDMAIAITAGETFLGKNTTKTGVLYVPTELDRLAVHERIQDYDTLPDNLFVNYSWSSGNQALRDAEMILTRGDIRVLIFDMFLPIVPEIETNAYETSSVFLAWRQLAQKYESAIIEVWHAGKTPRSDFMDAAIGTTGLIGQSDSVISLDRKRGESNGTLYIGGNHGKEDALKVIFENCHWHLAVGEGGDFLSSGDTELLELVNGREETTPTAVAAVTGRTYNAARMALARLYERGLIDKTGRGIYGPHKSEHERTYT